LFCGPGTTTYAPAGSHWKPSRMIITWMIRSTKTSQVQDGDEGCWILEVEKLTRMVIWRFRSIGKFLLCFLLFWDQVQDQWHCHRYYHDRNAFNWRWSFLVCWNNTRHLQIGIGHIRSHLCICGLFLCSTCA
jgi:hypothetical protein